MDWYNEEGAAKDSSQFTGMHRCMIKEAEKVTAASGAEGLKLRIATLDRKDDAGKPKELTLATIWLVGKNGPIDAEANKVSAMFMLLGASPKNVKLVKCKRYSSEIQDTVDTEVDMYTDLLNKKVSLFIQLSNNYPRKYVDPNSAEDFDSLSEMPKESHGGIWMPDYTKERSLSFKFLRSFDIASSQTYSEKKDGKTGKLWKEMTDKMVDYVEPIKDYEQLVDYFIKEATKNSIILTSSLFTNPTSSESHNSNTEVSAGDVPF